MSEFNKEAFLEHIRIHRNESKLDIAKWAWRQQQAIIDDGEAALKDALSWVEDLKRERDFLQKKCAERADKIDELQKRIDGAVEKLQWQNWKQWEIVRDKAIRILRGEHE